MIKTYSAAAALTLGLTLGLGGTAYAVDSTPIAGTAACTDLVNGQSDVLLARGTVQKATATLNTDLRTTPVDDATVTVDRQNLADAQSKLRVVVANVTGSLCRRGPVTTTTPTTPTVPVRPVPVFPEHPRPVVVVPPASTMVERPTTVVQNPVTVPEHTTVVNTVIPTVDDGSTAVTSGSQVKSVPEGSASTGEA